MNSVYQILTYRNDEGHHLTVRRAEGNCDVPIPDSYHITVNATLFNKAGQPLAQGSKEVTIEANSIRGAFKRLEETAKEGTRSLIQRLQAELEAKARAIVLPGANGSNMSQALKKGRL